MPLTNNVYLNSDKDSFGYVTSTKRWPALINNSIDDIKQEISEISGNEEKKHEGEAIIAGMQNLHDSIANNAVVEPIIADVVDKDVYNNLLTVNGEPQRWSQLGWLDSECLVYRKLQIVVSSQKLWRGYDYFARMKNSTFLKSSEAVSVLADRYHKISTQLTTEDVPAEAIELLAHEFLNSCLWGNATDLSLLVTVSLEELKKLQVSAAHRDQETLLVNDFKRVWRQLQSEKGGRVDIVLDNSGFELYTDLVFSLFLLDSNLAEQIVLHPKDFPWMVSDVLPTDLPALIELLSSSLNFPDNREAIGFLVDKLSYYLSEGQLFLRTNSFWTTPLPYREINKNGKLNGDQVFRDLRGSKLVIFKGDLNYRKLTADIKWPYTTPFKTAIQDLAETHLPIVALRTVKADVIVGLPEGKGEELDKAWAASHPNEPGHGWAWGGKYAVISFNK